jgi:acyl carrier protein
MDREEVKEKVYKILDSQGFGTELIEENYCYFNDMGMDSLDSVEYIVALEKEFKISMSDEEMETLYQSSVGATIDSIHEMVK